MHSDSFSFRLMHSDLQQRIRALVTVPEAEARDPAVPIQG
jgi:hypothetical protein